MAQTRQSHTRTLQNQACRAFAEPKIPSARLYGAKNRYKIKLRQSGYRLVYQVKDRELLVLVIAIGKHERDEVYKIADLFQKLKDVLEGRELEVHLDINPDEVYGSSCVVNEAIGYIRGMCNVIPMVKPNAFAATNAADRLKFVLAKAA